MPAHMSAIAVHSYAMLVAEVFSLMDMIFLFRLGQASAPRLAPGDQPGRPYKVTIQEGATAR